MNKDRALSCLNQARCGGDFLKKVTTRPMQTLKADGAVIDIPNRSLRRVDTGKEPTAKDLAGLENFAYELSAESAELFTDVGISWLRDNQNAPNLLRDIEAGFGKRLSGELVDLAFNGTGVGDDPFLKLNAGWLKIANGDKNAHKVTFDITSDQGWVAGLASIIKAMPAQFVASSVLIMNPLDMFQYGYEVGIFTKNKDAIANEKQVNTSINLIFCDKVRKSKDEKRKRILNMCGFEDALL